jgi:hypothetical protein
LLSDVWVKGALGSFLEVVVTRAKLSSWFDHLYDDGFSWRSDQGERRFASMLNKTLLVARHCESTYQVCPPPTIAPLPF